MTVTTPRRSNRPLTQFACQELEDFAFGKIKDDRVVTQGNTTIKVLQESSVSRLFKVFLFDQQILNVTFVDGKPFGVFVSFTDFYDSFGQPTFTTVERLNGLLDCLGVLGILPVGTRIFRDKSGSEPMTYLGKGENKSAVGQGIADGVYIKANSKMLDIVGYLASIEIGDEDVKDS